MKKNLKALFAFIIATVFTMTSCAKFADGSGSVWQGGLWIIPALTLIGATVFGYRAYKSSKSGSIHVDKETGKITDQSDINVPIYKSGSFYFAIAFLVATLIMTCTIVSER